MPIFEFHCNDCGTDFEKLVFSSDPAVECPQCHTLRQPHRVCPSCGYYRGEEVVKIKEEKK